MQKLMGFALQQAIVQRLNQWVFIGLLNLRVDVRIVDALASRNPTLRIHRYRLSALPSPLTTATRMVHPL